MSNAMLLIAFGDKNLHLAASLLKTINVIVCNFL